MSESNYHLEALRKQRVIQRKKDALDKLANGHQDTCEQQGGIQQAKDTIYFTGSGEFDNCRSGGLEQQIPNFKKDEGVVFDEVVHDPNFNYRILKETGHPPIHVDPIYKIMYPGAVIYKNKPEKFRVNNEGYQNRYRDRQNLAPHCDLAYAVIYPGKDNSDYTRDQNRNNRRMNQKLDKYDIQQRINGEFHVQVLKATPQ